MLQTKLLITGKVKGVGYRAFVSTVARMMKITGKVKNINDLRYKDDKVEVVCECNDEKELETFMKMLARKDGRIIVEKVEILEKKEMEKPQYTWFFIDYE